MADSETRDVSAPPGTAPSPYDAPQQLGPYRVLELINEGGMGAVYKAEQRHPIRRTVAIKVIKLGLDTKEVIARFDSERQALARMDHPNIARVLDAGATETGRPYFAMEYVPGVPITRFADDHKLTVRQRLELFIPVCDAIAHAHTKAIIHRDIKASNVLASVGADGKPTVKVIDFGIAKALTSDRLTDPDVQHRARADHGHGRQHESRAGRRLARRGHADGRLLARRAAVRVADRREAVQPGGAAQRVERGDQAARSRTPARSRSPPAPGRRCWPAPSASPTTAAA